MRVILLKSFESPASLCLEEIPIPALRPGEVLVKIAAASINPSDLVFLRNQYGIKKQLPVVPGFEGSGTVVDSNAGFYGRWLTGRRVACKAPEDGNGTWAEYMICRREQCIPLRKSVTLEQGASLIVNPLTAWSLLEMVRRDGSRAFVQTAAGSALGQMLMRLARRYGMESINIVRRREQVERLKAAGGTYVLDSSESGFTEQLKILSQRFHAKIAFDAVGGELTAKLAGTMPPGSKIVVYGALSGENCPINPSNFIFQRQTVTGFWLTQWFKEMSAPARMGIVWRVQNMLGAELATHVQARYPLEKIYEAIEFYKKNRSQGKVLLLPGVRLSVAPTFINP